MKEVINNAEKWSMVKEWSDQSMLQEQINCLLLSSDIREVQHSGLILRCFEELERISAKCPFDWSPIQSLWYCSGECPSIALGGLWFWEASGAENGSWILMFARGSTLDPTNSFPHWQGYQRLCKTHRGCLERCSRKREKCQPWQIPWRQAPLGFCPAYLTQSLFSPLPASRSPTKRVGLFALSVCRKRAVWVCGGGRWQFFSL